MNDDRLTPEEDAELRRLHWFMSFGMVTAAVAKRYDELRRRDRRIEVREPNDQLVTLPVVDEPEDF